MLRQQMGREMGRLGSYIVWVMTMLAPLSASASAPDHATGEQGMCSELPSFAAEGDTAGPGLSPLATSVGVGASAGASLATFEVQLSHGAESPEPVLWCLTPDDPRCSPIDEGQQVRDSTGREAARPTGTATIPPAGHATIAYPPGPSGGARSSHRMGIERPPRD